MGETEGDGPGNLQESTHPQDLSEDRYRTTVGGLASTQFNQETKPETPSRGLQGKKNETN